MKDKNDEILELLKQVDFKLEYIKNRLDNDSNILNKHINFIESVYNTMKSPISYICNKFNKKQETIELPEVKPQKPLGDSCSSDSD